ncbi:hypothetical protein [Krasilnikovia sp. MM14-A1259]|uniref:hypothetical protein n=1 Tax=Krasilnikovia sp. MM14-A1259 TaxID=3373539 RepID=UPI00380F4A85
MKIPTFSHRQADPPTDGEPRGAVAAPPREDRKPAAGPVPTGRHTRPVAERAAIDDTIPDRGIATRDTENLAPRDRAALGPKPRASLLATLALIAGVASALLVLSGPLIGYGIAVAVLGLVLALAGFSATGKRHVAGRTDALIAMAVALGAIVVGVLALSGSLSWLGTDMQPASSLREWLDARFAIHF